MSHNSPLKKTSCLYLDYNATAPVDFSVKEKLKNIFDVQGNPSSIHGHGRAARQVFEEARQVLSATLKTSRFDDIIFNSGGTEGNNTVLKSFQTVEMIENGAKIFVSAIEHACVLNSAQNAVRLPVNNHGVLDLEILEQTLFDAHQENVKAPLLVSVMLVNNETGVIQPLGKICEISKKYGAYVHSDAVQSLGRIPVDIEQYPVDYMTFSGHKIGGFTGFGALYVRAKAPYTAMINGGGQEKNKRSGTSNTFGAISFKVALENALDQGWQKIEKCRDFIESELSKICPDLEIWGQNAPRVANTSSLYMPGVSNITQVMFFDMEGISVSAGSACSSGKIAPSHVLSAMKVPEQKALETCRVSMGPHATKEDAQKFIDVWVKIYTRNLKMNNESHAKNA